ncbi:MULTISPECIES: hemerythrin domain-containing protein [Microbacterium]|uniref:Hemerythrin domain-containing protein n=1 Tax=Microbacterium profundi TaxID=450380 RepID=A0ABV3LLC1_9MICO|nr:hemerythrin domain-containing protein [Microbacterium sp. AR7-10]
MSQKEENGPADTDNPGGVPRDQPDHHAGLWSTLVQRADDLTGTVGADHDDASARSALVAFLRGDVLAHLESEERVLYEAVREAGAHSLVDALELDHRCLLNLVEQIEKADTVMEAALSSRALVVLFALRMEKEDTIILPTLREAGVDVSALLDRMIVRMATDYDSHFTYF